ncbi:MAG: putative RNA-binding protein [uncultured Acidilobus sp. JCHS]|jgi:Predicted RNA-binding protein|nr:MAG: putative RNA-binding protein [uncultured Acidilobus sp. JCHS]
MASRGPPRREPIDVTAVERRAIVLDYIEGGYYLDPHRWHRSRTVAQAIGFNRFTLLDGIPLQRVEPLEEVTVVKESLMPIEEPLDPTGRRTRKLEVSLVCLEEIGKKTCTPLQHVEQRVLDLLRIALGDEVELLGSPAELSKTAESKGLPPKLLAAPKSPLKFSDLTELAKRNLKDAVKIIVRSREKEFVEFFNKAAPINIRLHAIELLRGVGKKTLKAILDARERKPFQSFDEIKKLLKDDPVDVLADKVVEELSGQSTYNLFIEPESPSVPFLDYLSVLRPAGRQR